MQRLVRDQTSLLPHRSHFDMWHDYMDLGRRLQHLCGSREVETRATSGPKTVLRAPSGQQLAPHREEDLNISMESIHLSSDSSLSDTSCSVTSSDYCRFCKQNGESAVIYRSHNLKSSDGKVTCPILWDYTCPICDATGDNAHTRRYCPQVQRHSAGMTPPRSRFW